MRFIKNSNHGFAAASLTLLVPHEEQPICKMELNMTALPRTIISTENLPKVSWAKGCYIYDVDGKQYIDGSGGPAVYCIGHSNSEVNDAIKAQLDRVAHGYRYFFTSNALEELSDIVRGQCGGTLKHFVYVTGGSEAVESCLKIALQYHAARGEMSRRRFIARERSWHGSTIGALSVSGFLERVAPFEGSLLDVS
ncbi:MAG TPA: aminotransferase class III-fold pyridoxal phosphate-dependent enzyme, partial [Aestuariivirga sp.]|nr:aminotransferase class III-fold pyridoxal phosphate-dependent enzyme [Aestuariivirga sp.]